MRIWVPVLAATLAACGGDGSSSPPSQNLEDTTPPVITLSGANPQIIEAGEAYTELGATATDDRDDDVSGSIVIDASAVNTAVPGEYPVTYDVTDLAGNAATTVTRTVICQDTTAPVITLTGANPQTLSQGGAYVELGATATDSVDGDLTAMLVIDASAVDTATVDDYTVTYDVSDAAGNAAVTLMRTVRVVLAVPAEPTVSVAADIKQLIFTWDEIAYTDYYRLLENPDGSSGFTQVGEDIPAGTTSVTIPIAVHLQDWVNAEYVVEACNRKGCNSSDWVNMQNLMLDTIGYFKASNTELGDNFGEAVALSADGSTLAVGARLESSIATGIGGDQDDNSAGGSGAVYLFRFDGTVWAQQAYIKASNTESGDGFGGAVALSGDGNALAVGARFEDSSAVGIGGNQVEDFAGDSGAVYLFRFDGEDWSQQAYVKASNTGTLDLFGWAVALSADGNTLAVTARLEDSNAIGIDGNQNDDSALSSGAAYVFRFDGTGWTQQSYVKASNTDAGDQFGRGGVALSASGDTLAVGAPIEGSIATGIGGDQDDNSAGGSGAVYLFRFDGTVWAQQAYIKASNTESGDGFGGAVALSGDGNALAVGARFEDSSAVGIGGNQVEDFAGNSGAVYLFRFDGEDWSQQAYVKASNTGQSDLFGSSVALSGSGDTLVVAAANEDSSATGVGGNQSDDLADDSGAVYVFQFDGTDWSQQNYVKATNTQTGDQFFRISLGADGNILAVGATGEDANASGIAGDQSDNTAESAGALYLF